MWWLEGSGAAKHRVPPAISCQACGCENVQPYPLAYVDSFPKGADFHCGMLPSTTSTTLPPRGKFVTAGKHVYWIEGVPPTKHVVPPELRCEECGCNDNVEPNSLAYVGAIPDGPPFECQLITTTTSTTLPGGLLGNLRLRDHLGVGPLGSHDLRTIESPPTAGGWPPWPQALGALAAALAAAPLCCLCCAYASASPETRQDVHDTESLAPLMQDFPCTARGADRAGSGSDSGEGEDGFVSGADDELPLMRPGEGRQRT